MKTLFDPIEIGNLHLANRIVRSATLRGFAAKDGVVTETEQAVLQGLAEGGVGLIITGMMGVGFNSCVHGEMIRIYDRRFPETYGRVVEAVHQHGGVLVAQLGQCGAKASVVDCGDHLHAPSDIELTPGQPAKEMTKEEISRVISEFSSAALRCKEAGADGVQIHAAHGYLISEFLSPYFNKRQDEYGGSIENRARLLFEVYKAVREAVGTSYPVFMKINSSDLTEQGMTAGESLWVCRTMAQMGLTAIEVSGGISVSPSTRSTPPGLTLQTQGIFSEVAAKISAQVDIPVISVGGYRTLEFAETVLNESNIQAISLSRPLIREPDLVQRWQSGERTSSGCISCNRCMGSVVPICPCLADT